MIERVLHVDETRLLSTRCLDCCQIYVDDTRVWRTCGHMGGRVARVTPNTLDSWSHAFYCARRRPGSVSRSAPRLPELVAELLGRRLTVRPSLKSRGPHGGTYGLTVTRLIGIAKPQVNNWSKWFHWLTTPIFQ
jgi:hypothetical protein